MPIFGWFLLTLQKRKRRKQPECVERVECVVLGKGIRTLAQLRILWIDFSNIILNMFYSDVLIFSNSSINHNVALQISAGFRGAYVGAAFDQS